jgi:hypothetical protein
LASDSWAAKRVMPSSWPALLHERESVRRIVRRSSRRWKTL